MGDRPVIVRDPAALGRWCEENRRRLKDRGIWLLGREPGTMDPAGFSPARLRILLVRLSPYSEVSRGISHAYLFQMARTVPGVYVDFAFLPPAGDEEKMRAAGIPLLIGTGSKRAPLDFDLLAVSNSVVQELLNLPGMLFHSGIPLSRGGRAAVGAPLVILGGSNSYATSILHGPVGRAEPGEGLVDGVLVGDGEGVWPRLVGLLADGRGLPRGEQLAALRRDIPGFYDPAAYRQVFGATGTMTGIEAVLPAPLPVRAHRVQTADWQEGFTGGPLWYDEESAGASHLLLSAGCPYFCAFCKESWEQKPYRERPADSLVREATTLKANLGLREVALLTFNVPTYSELVPLLDRLDPLFDRVAIKSQRFDAIAHAPHLLERQLEAGKRTFTCAMEGISDRIRGLLQKSLGEKVILAGFGELFRRNIRQMKIFLIVTGWEEEADLAEFSRFLGQIKAKLEGLKGRPLLTFSLAALFRPPHTPLQFAPPAPRLPVWEALFGKVAAVVRKAGFETRVSAHPVDALVSEALAYADRRGTAALVSASVGKGFRYHGEMPVQVWSFLETAEGLQQPASSTVRPWDDVDTGVSTDFLRRSHDLLLAGNPGTSCIAPPLGGGRCLGCGACGSPGEKNRLTGLQVSAGKAPTTREETRPVRFSLVEAMIPRRWADCGDGFLAAAVARLLMRSIPGTVAGLLRLEGVVPRRGAFGYWRAIAHHRGGLATHGAMGFPLEDPENPDLKILQIREVRGAGDGAWSPIVCRVFPAEAGGDAIPRRVDAFLVRYRLKHQKRWQGETLDWDIAEGHAGKMGPRRIQWTRGTKTLQLWLKHWPEAFVWDALAGEAEVEILPA